VVLSQLALRGEHDLGHTEGVDIFDPGIYTGGAALTATRADVVIAFGLP
jgi:hypothetical protein